MANHSPAKVFRIGLVNASAFMNVIEPKGGQGQKKALRSVNRQRRYFDEKEDPWESATSFQRSDLPTAIRVLQRAQQYVERVEAEVSP